MESRLFGFTTNNLKSLAYQLAKKNKKDYCFNDNKDKVGKDWLLRFLKPHPDLTNRKLRTINFDFNKVAVDNFYTLLGEICDKQQLTPRVFNCGENKPETSGCINFC